MSEPGNTEYEEEDESGRQSNFDQTADDWKRWKSGDMSAPNRMVERHIPDLEAYFQWALGYPREVRGTKGIGDLVNEVVRRALKKFYQGKFEPRGPGMLWLWLRTIARNTLYEYWRSRKRRKGFGSLPPDIPGNATTPPEALKRKRFWELYEDTLEKLDPKKRCAWLHRYDLKWPWSSVAAQCGFKTDDGARHAAKEALKIIGRELENGGFGPESF